MSVHLDQEKIEFYKNNLSQFEFDTGSSLGNTDAMCDVILTFTEKNSKQFRDGYCVGFARARTQNDLIVNYDSTEEQMEHYDKVFNDNLNKISFLTEELAEVKYEDAVDSLESSFNSLKLFETLLKLIDYSSETKD